MVSNMKLVFCAMVALALTPLSPSARAATQDIDLTGWTARNHFGTAGNTARDVWLPAGAVVTGFSYSALVFSTLGSSSSQLTDLVLSVNSDSSSSPAAWLDWKPFAEFGQFGLTAPLSGAWGLSAGPDPYPSPPYGLGGPFATLPGGPVFVTTYLSYAPASGIAINAGTLSISYNVAVVAEPRSFVLMGLGLLGIAAIARRRRAD
jgi:hypothetical protein